MFDDEDYLESRNFSPLHKVVLSLARGDLRQQLEASTSTIDDRDADGLTALHWATARGNVDAVKVLLEFGAAPNVYSRRGHSPLTWAAQSPSARRAEIVQELLNHGADVNHPDSYNRTPLLNAAADPDDPTCIKLFVNSGADVNWQDCHKRTPLGYAAKMGNCHNLSYLLSQGADPHIPDHWGHTPFSEAAQQNHHGILQLLLQEDPIIPGSKLLNGLSILHLAAAHGDVETLRILASGDTRTLNLDKCNAEGLTAEDLFNLRSDAGLELNEACHALIETIIQNHSALGQGEIERIDDADLDVDEFADAVEYQNVEELDT
jgi:ankyrin repeat protein